MNPTRLQFIIDRNTTDNLAFFQTNERFHKLKVMLVEDNKINMLLLKTIIKTY
jgi:hypothetical protein